MNIEGAAATGIWFPVSDMIPFLWAGSLLIDVFIYIVVFYMVHACTGMIIFNISTQGMDLL